VTHFIEQLAHATPQQPVRLGNYAVTGLIGAGGMGAVYDAVHVEHGGRVALKTLTHLDPGSLLRFKTEFRAVADLAHPNLVSLDELSGDGDLWYFTMEHIDGVDFLERVRGEPGTAAATTAARTLPGSPRASRRVHSDGHAPAPATAIAGGQPAPPRSIADLRDALAQLVRAVHALHQAGLVHQDLKPSNVLVEHGGRVVVLDFGLVRAVDEARPAPDEGAGSVSISGTPIWMAPEQFAPGPTGPAADWYAVGLMLYIGLTGVPPFPDADVASTGYVRQRLVPTPPAELVPDLPADLSALAVALLAADPADRPTGATLVALLAGDAAAPVAHAHAHGQFVGRHAERAWLCGLIDHTCAGGAALAQVRGPSGAGKSALIEAVLVEVTAARGALALRGRCYERERVPYKAFDGMLDDLAARLALEPADQVRADLPAGIAALVSVFPVLATVPAIAAQLAEQAPLPASVSIVHLRRRAVDALRALFDRLAARRPLVIAIDDLQWADADSITLLRRLVDAPALPGVMVALGLRREEAAANPDVAAYLAALDDTAAAGGAGLRVAALDIGPLPMTDARVLADGILATLGVRADDLAEAIARESAGVPFFVEELARFAADHHAPGADSAAATAGVTLERVLAWRVRSLPAAERRLIETLSVANNPIPLPVALEVAGVESGALATLGALRGKRLIRSTGTGARDRVELHHDHMRAAQLAGLAAARTVELHLALGRSLAARADDDAGCLFDAIRHLDQAAALLSPAERLDAGRLGLDAGRSARGAGAFRLAFECFRAGVALLADDGWASAYPLALALHAGAAESAYLCAEWRAVDHHVAIVKAHARTVFDQLDAIEVELDAAIARRDYAGAVEVAVAVLAQLDVDIPAYPSEADVGAAVGAAMASLAQIGPAGLLALPAATDPRVVAAMRLQARIISAAYFGRPLLLPLLACRLVSTAVAHGVAGATAYALAVHGIVLNTLGLHGDAHQWGEIALALQARSEDRRFEARTLHVVHNLVCVWTVPLADTLAPLRHAVEVGKETGDIEFAGYAAHSYAHNALYAARPLAGVDREAHELGEFMRGHEEINALHVHVLFERLLGCLCGRSATPATLDGDGFTEEAALATAVADGSRSGQCLVRIVMGLARFLFGDPVDASRWFEEARPLLDGLVSTWHVPIFHQYAALAILRLPAADRAARRAEVDGDLAALRALAAHGPINFAHRAAMIEAELARVADHHAAAAEAYARTLALADAGGWTNDLALAHELTARWHHDAGRAELAADHRAGARAAYARWGATAKLDGAHAI
jgi:predicted ATPase